jgi:hypothetical protein
MEFSCDAVWIQALLGSPEGKKSPAKKTTPETGPCMEREIGQVAERPAIMLKIHKNIAG